MSTLHVINKSDAALWSSCVATLSRGDSVLLIEDAVYAGLPEQQQNVFVPEGVKLIALSEDLAVRGISAKIRPEIGNTTYSGFVALSLAHERVVSWQ
jgi:tRNA 2-thiouridine synthesizing protein B